MLQILSHHRLQERKPGQGIARNARLDVCEIYSVQIFLQGKTMHLRREIAPVTMRLLAIIIVAMCVKFRKEMY
jgi:hypothetical protein